MKQGRNQSLCYSINGLSEDGFFYQVVFCVYYFHYLFPTNIMYKIKNGMNKKPKINYKIVFQYSKHKDSIYSVVFNSRISDYITTVYIVIYSLSRINLVRL